MHKTQKKEAERTFFNNLEPEDILPNEVYSKIASKCLPLLNQNNSDILESGSGNGKFGKHLAKSGQNVTGVDVLENMINRLPKKL